MLHCPRSCGVCCLQRAPAAPYAARARAEERASDHHTRRGGSRMTPTRSSASSAAAASVPTLAPAAGRFQRLSHVLSAVLFLVGGSMALLASLALPWVRWTCGAPGIPATLEELRFCATEAAAQPPYLVDYLGPLGSQLRGLPLGTALAAQFVSFGPAALCLLAALPALVAHRSASWQRMGVSLGVVGGLSGVVS